MLLSVLVAGVVLAATVAAGFGQGNAQGPYGGAAAPALGPGLQGSSSSGNDISLSLSVASQQGSRTYFLVNKIAIASPGSPTAALYELNGALPGEMDSSDNSFQIDMGQLSSYASSPRQVSVNDLYTIMRPDVNVLMLTFRAGPASTQGGQTVFQVSSIDGITPDGAQQSFRMSQPISLVYDQSSGRMYTVSFSQLSDYFNTYLTNVQNNYYTTVVYTINVVGPIPVTPAIVYPVLTPVAFPAPFPIYYRVPFRVPFPTYRPTYRPSGRPSGKPTPSGSPGPTITGRPTVSGRPTPSGSPAPTVSARPTPSGRPTLRPTGLPSATLRPTLRPTFRPTLTPSAAPTGTPRPTYRPSLTPTRAPVPTAVMPTRGPVPTYRPPVTGPTGGPIVTYRPPASTYRPPAVGYGGQPGILPAAGT